MAIDLGARRTGIAISDAFTKVITPLEVLSIADRDQLLAAIQRLITDHLGPARTPPRAEIIVGLPLNMDDSEGPASKAARDFGARIAEATGHPVRFMDERLSSVQAEWELARSGLTRAEKKERRDARAAAAILRDFLESQSPNRNNPDSDGS